MLKAIGPVIAKVVQQVEPHDEIQEAIGWAYYEDRQDILDACGRIQCDMYSGAHRGPASRADWRMVRAYIG